MHRRTVPLLLVMLTVSVAAYSGFSRNAPVYLSQSSLEIDHVTLYQGGLAAIRMEREFDANGLNQTLVFLLPTTAVFDSLSVKGDGVRVSELRSSLAADAGLHAGDQLIVRMEGGIIVNGSLVSQDGNRLLLQTPNGIVRVEGAHILTVEVLGRALAAKSIGSSEVTLVVRATPGHHIVRLSYLAQGSGWTPNHILDPRSGDFTFFATLAGLQDWSNVTLDLVSGSPNMVYAPNYASPMLSLAFSGINDKSYDGDSYAPPVGPSEQLGDLHRYHHVGQVSFHRGETVRIPMVTGHMDVLRHYYEANAAAYVNTWTSLPEKYEVRNSLSEPLPAGAIRLYLDGEFVGADHLQGLGKGELGNVTAAFSNDVKARVVLVDEQRGGYTNFENGQRRQDVTSHYDVQVRNLREGADARIDLRAVLQVTGEDARTSQIRPAADQVLGSTIIWNEHVGGGDTAHHTLTVATRPYV